MSFNAKDMTQGGQIASMRIRMFSQIANIMLYCLFIFFWILIGLVLWVKISWQTFINGCIYWWCTSLEGMRDLIKSQPVYEIQYYGKTFRMNAAQVLHDKYMIWCGEQLWSACSGVCRGPGYLPDHLLCCLLDSGASGETAE